MTLDHRSSKIVCSWSSDLWDNFAVLPSVNESKTERPPTSNIDEPGTSTSSCLITRLGSATEVGDDERQVRSGMKPHNVSYVQLTEPSHFESDSDMEIDPV